MQIDVTEAQSGQTLRVRVGDRLGVTLLENASGGYRWTLERIVENRLMLEETNHHGGSRAVGGQGAVTWTLRALASGHTVLGAKKWRPWEGDRLVIERFSIALEIEPSK